MTPVQFSAVEGDFDQLQGGVVAGLLLAAGGGRRFGMPKALAVSGAETWVTRSSRVLLEAGCNPLVVVIGAGAQQVRPLIPAGTTVVENSQWSTGMGSSLRAGLLACAELPVQVKALVVLLVDLPGIQASTISHFLGQMRRDPSQALLQASFNGVIGHPVLLGRKHWELIGETAVGDSGARSYLAQHGAELIELGHLADGSDQDTAPGTTAE